MLLLELYIDQSISSYDILTEFFNSDLEILTESINKEKKYMYMMGDYNINTLLNPTRLSSEIQSFINIFAESGY